MTYTIRLFAGLIDLIGNPIVTLENSSSTMSAGELKKALALQYPAAAAAIESCFVACNRAYAAPEELVAAEDEIALIPPVSGGESKDALGTDESSTTITTVQRYQLTYGPLQIEAIASVVQDPNHGAALVFVGTTRELTAGQRTVRLEYEAYEPMALATLEQIGNEIADRWPDAKCAISHRLGVVEIGEVSVVIAVSLPHRTETYEASRYAIERLKQIVPIWKKEIWEDGSEWKGHQLGPWDPTVTSE